MAKIFVSDLHAIDSEFPLIFLKQGETDLIKTAVERAINTRRIGGGCLYSTRGMRVGMIADIQ
jgi:hypothetical protein